MVPLAHSYIDILTNAVALIPIYRFVVSRDYPGAILCCLTFLSTIGSAYINRLLKTRAQNNPFTLLDIYQQPDYDDTLFRYILITYSIYRSYVITNTLEQPAILAFTGLMTSFFSKATNKYPILHSIMNVFFYGTIAYTI